MKMMNYDEYNIALINGNELENLNNVATFYKDKGTISDVVLYVIGCGGTGGYFIRDAARILNQFENIHPEIDCDIVLIDGDKVEEKNIKRQNFITSDIGKYKSEVLATRYSSLFNNIKYYTNYIKDAEQFNDILDSFDNNNDIDCLTLHLVFSFVDNVECRRIINSVFEKKMKSDYRNLLWVDLGNEKTYGQLVALDTSYSRITLNDVFTDLDSISSREQQSCADMADPQTAAANIMAASIASTYLYNYLYDQNMRLPNMIKFSTLPLKAESFYFSCVKDNSEGGE